MKKQKGITLIALVITIIILLILAGVALSLVAGQEGILVKGETAVLKSNEASAKEQAELMVAEFAAEYYEKKFANRETGFNSKKIDEYIIGKIENESVSSNGEFKIKVEGEKITLFDKAEVKLVSGIVNEKGKLDWNAVVENPYENEEWDWAYIYM